MTALWLVVGLALAGDATAEVEGTTVRGAVTVPVAPEVVLDALADPTFEDRIQQGDAEITLTKQDGACQQVAYVFPHPIMTTSYELRRCRVDGGWDISLVRSDSFDSYRGSWRATSKGKGARLVFEVDLTSSVRWVPQSLVRSEMKRNVRKLMEAVGAWAEAKATTSK